MAYLESKPRYEILDGLRGVAALIVVAYHLFETYNQQIGTQIINHGYLAVDFFYALSGFVIGYAYDDRWKDCSSDKSKYTSPSPCGEGRGGVMTHWSFFKRRIVRLHPMVVMGTLVGVSVFYLQDCEGWPLIARTGVGTLLLMAMAGMLMVPSPAAWDIRGWQDTYPINGAQWSLFWEYVANILYALVIRHFRTWMLVLFVACSAVLTLDLGLGLDLFGLLANGGHDPFRINGGWGIEGVQLYIGVTRLCYPFFCGLLLSRLGRFITLRGGFWWCSLIMAAVLAVPAFGDSDTFVNGIYDTLCVLLIFPLVVAIGAGSRITDARSLRWCKALGDISFPLYIVHQPITSLQMAWAESHAHLPVGTHIFVSAGIYFLALAIAYAAMKLYDEPVREWLKSRI